MVFKLFALTTICLGFTSAQMLPNIKLPDALSDRLPQMIKLSDILNDPPPKTPFLCPSSKSIAPCTCDQETSSGACDGYKITENHITNFFTALRKANKKSSTDWLQMVRFELTRTELNTLSMTPFRYLNISALFIGANFQLTTLTSSNFDQDLPTDEFLKVSQLAIVMTAVRETTIGGFFRQIDLPLLKILQLNNNQIKATLPELIHGLTEMTQLVWLALDNNQITQVSNGQFENNQNLLILGLANNQLEVLGDDAFIFSPLPKDHPHANTTMWILVDKNNLGGSSGAMSAPPSSKISDTAFSKVTRSALVMLDGNSLETLSANKFQTFLDNTKTSVLTLKNNLFQCDKQMKWLRVKRSDYENRVYGADCQNDKGKTIFTTDKI